MSMMDTDLPTFADVEAAAARLRGLVRRTPLLDWRPRPSFSAQGLDDDVRVLLKLEHLQLGGSFKLRGALNALLLAGDEARRRGVYTASGGNHGIGVALAARRLAARAVVYLPESAPAESERRLRDLGAEVARGGAAWDDAWALAQEAAAERGGLLLHPFDDAAVIAGQGTVALELLDDAPEVDLLVCGIGGGGLAGGAGTVARARGAARVVGVEPVGADAMSRSLAAGRVVRLAEVRTIAGTLAPRTTASRNLRLFQERCAGVVLVSDDELRAAQALLWDDLRQRVEPAGAASLAALAGGHLAPWLEGARTIALLVCGANG